MKKLYLVLLTCFLIISGALQAQLKTRLSTDLQRKSLSSFNLKNFVPQKNGTSVKNTLFGNRTSGAGCDTINAAAADTFGLAAYFLGSNGFVTGVNIYDDKEKAAYFYDTLGNTILTKAIIFFAVANTNTPANLNKIVPIHVYNINGGEPDSILATVNKTLAEIKADVDQGKFTIIDFPGGVTLPPTAEFFISVDMSKLSWDTTTTASPKDSLAVYSTQLGDLQDFEERDQFNGTFFEKWDDDSWNIGYYAWSTISQTVDLNLFIFPVVGTSPSCGTLPITLTQFSGERLADKNVLKWITQTEQNSKGFELQRSADGTNFSTLQFLQSKAGSGFSTSNLTYTFNDVKAFKGNNYYRLKQVDKDGKFTYSSIVILKGGKAVVMELNNLYPNPAKSNVNMVISSPVNTKVTVMISDLTGRLVMQKNEQVISGENTLKVNVEKISSGTYFIKVVCADGCETGVQKFVKQ